MEKCSHGPENDKQRYCTIKEQSMKLQRYWVGNEEGEGLPEACNDGEWMLAKEVEAEKQTLIEMFKSCRDATGYSDR